MTSATNKQVVLTWTASSGATSYVVQRSPLGAPFVSLTPSATTTTFTDTAIDAFTTYTYMVFAVSSGGTSVASNQVEMGPPTVGFSMVSPTPTKALDPSQYGRQVSLALDANGDPAIAFLWINPSNSGNGIDSVVYFVGWDRAHYKWKAPVQVDVCGNTYQSGGNITLSLASDPSNGMLGLAYEKNVSTVPGAGDQLGLAFSKDNGATWTVQSGRVDGIDQVFYPVLALFGGQAYVSFANGNYIYETGSETATASSWSMTTVPLPKGGTGTFGPIVTMALDNTGKPAVAYWYNDANNTTSIGYWRPGSSTASRAVATNYGNSNLDLRMAFFGIQPRVFYWAFTSDNGFNGIDQVWEAQSSDGVTWNAAVPMPNDGSTSFSGPLSFAIKSTGFATGVESVNGGNNSVPQKCGYPKWSQSSDLVNWTTCSPQGLGHPILTGNYSYPSAAYGANDKIYLAFEQFDNTLADFATGVLLYREPLVAGQVPPNLGTGGAVNGASFTAGGPVAPGSIFSIFGTNLASQAGGSTAVPLSTTLVSTSVSVAGALAPLYYVSPGQINAQIPFATATGAQPVTVTVNGLESNTITVPVAASAPGIFLYNGNYAVAQNANYSIIGPNNPTTEGNVIIVYATGEGAVSNQPATGAAAPASPTAQASLVVTATIGGKNAPVQYAGLSAGFVGLLQVNLQTPTGLTAGDYPMVITIGGAASNSALISLTP